MYVYVQNFCSLITIRFGSTKVQYAVVDIALQDGLFITIAFENGQRLHQVQTLYWFNQTIYSKWQITIQYCGLMYVCLAAV